MSLNHFRLNFHWRCQDIQLITRAEKRITVATGNAGKPETDWLVREMNKALGKCAVSPRRD